MTEYILYCRNVRREQEVEEEENLRAKLLYVGLSVEEYIISVIYCIQYVNTQVYVTGHIDKYEVMMYHIHYKGCVCTNMIYGIWDDMLLSAAAICFLFFSSHPTLCKHI